MLLPPYLQATVGGPGTWRGMRLDQELFVGMGMRGVGRYLKDKERVWCVMRVIGRITLGGRWCLP